MLSTHFLICGWLRAFSVTAMPDSHAYNNSVSMCLPNLVNKHGHVTTFAWAGHLCYSSSCRHTSIDMVAHGYLVNSTGTSQNY